MLRKFIEPLCNVIGEDEYDIYDKIAEMALPKYGLHLVDGHGNFSFYPAAPCFTEVRGSSLLQQIIGREPFEDISKPFDMPLPYLLVSGPIGNCAGRTNIPTHNIDNVLNAVFALMDNPNMSTSDLVKIISGPELYVGGKIINEDELANIYETGTGTIRFSVSKETKSNKVISSEVESYKRYCRWYGYEIIKPEGGKKGEYEIRVPYNALLTNGTETRLFSLKEMLLEYIAFYKTLAKNRMGGLSQPITTIRAMMKDDRDNLCSDYNFTTFGI